ncbi:hypothetical protein GW829_14460, partial [bacterium]|nr:hypothetical protein [bacterium]
MAREDVYRKAEKKVEQAYRSLATELSLRGMGLTELPKLLAQLSHLQSLNLSENQLTVLPESIGNLTRLTRLEIWGNQISKIPESIRNLTNLTVFHLDNLTEFPPVIRYLKNLRELGIDYSQLTSIPDWIGELNELEVIYLNQNQLTDLPPTIAELAHLKELYLNKNPLNLELAAAYKLGVDAVKAYLRTKSNSIILNEAKLILVGEGEVGKTCLLNALRDEPFVEGLSTTHGIEIKSFQLINPDAQTEITLNGWDFGGQRVYRPTHQLFFSAPAVYLVVWKPREGPQQGFVKEWIKLVKHREPDAKILVVATHGGPQQRQPDIDRQELWDLFGKETVADFFFVDSKPDADGHRKGIEELKLAIARLAAELPEVGRSVPKSFQ